MKVGDIVRVKDSWHSEIFEKYWRGDLRGKRGEIVEVISRNGKSEGYRVKFASVSFLGEDDRKRVVPYFIWPFRMNDVKEVNGEIEFPHKRQRRNKQQLKSIKATARRLRKKGMKIKEIARQLEALPETVKNWIYR